MQTNTILICGGSATGKTILSKEVANHFKFDLIHLDTLRKKIQRQYSKQNPINILLKNQTYIISSDQQLLKYHQDISKFIIKKIGNYLTRRINQGNVIIEGDDLLPEFCKIFRKQKSVKIICLYENHHQSISKRISLRDSHQKGKGELVYRKQLKHAYLYGKEIHLTAKSLKITCIKSTPLPTLFARIIEAITRT